MPVYRIPGAQDPRDNTPRPLPVSNKYAVETARDEAGARLASGLTELTGRVLEELSAANDANKAAAAKERDVMEAAVIADFQARYKGARSAADAAIEEKDQYGRHTFLLDDEGNPVSPDERNNKFFDLISKEVDDFEAIRAALSPSGALKLSKESGDDIAKRVNDLNQKIGDAYKETLDATTSLAIDNGLAVAQGPDEIASLYAQANNAEFFSKQVRDAKLKEIQGALYNSVTGGLNSQDPRVALATLDALPRVKGALDPAQRAQVDPMATNNVIRMIGQHRDEVDGMIKDPPTTFAPIQLTGQSISALAPFVARYTPAQLYKLADANGKLESLGFLWAQSDQLLASADQMIAPTEGAMLAAKRSSRALDMDPNATVADLANHVMKFGLTNEMPTNLVSRLSDTYGVEQLISAANKMGGGAGAKVSSTLRELMNGGSNQRSSTGGSAGVAGAIESGNPVVVSGLKNASKTDLQYADAAISQLLKEKEDDPLFPTDGMELDKASLEEKSTFLARTFLRQTVQERLEAQGIDLDLNDETTRMQLDAIAIDGNIVERAIAAVVEGKNSINSTGRKFTVTDIYKSIVSEIKVDYDQLTGRLSTDSVMNEAASFALPAIQAELERNQALSLHIEKTQGKYKTGDAPDGWDFDRAQDVPQVSGYEVLDVARDANGAPFSIRAHVYLYNEKGEQFLVTDPNGDPHVFTISPTTISSLRFAPRRGGGGPIALQSEKPGFLERGSTLVGNLLHGRDRDYGFARKPGSVTEEQDVAVEKLQLEDALWRNKWREQAGLYALLSADQEVDTPALSPIPKSRGNMTTQMQEVATALANGQVKPEWGDDIIMLTNSFTREMEKKRVEVIGGFDRAERAQYDAQYDALKADIDTLRDRARDLQLERLRRRALYGTVMENGTPEQIAQRLASIDSQWMPEWWSHVDEMIAYMRWAEIEFDSTDIDPKEIRAMVSDKWMNSEARAQWLELAPDIRARYMGSPR